MREIDLEKPFEETAKWFFDEKKFEWGKGIVGRLKYTPEEGVKVHFDAIDLGNLFERVYNEHCLRGVSPSGVYYLHRCVKTKSSQSSSARGFFYSTTLRPLSPTLLFSPRSNKESEVSRIFEEAEKVYDNFLDTAYVHYKHLTEWWGFRPFDSNVADIPNVDTLRVEIPVKLEKKELSKTLQLRESFDIGNSIGKKPPEAKQVNNIKFDFQQKQTLANVVQQVNLLGNMLTFAMSPSIFGGYPTKIFMCNEQENYIAQVIPLWKSPMFKETKAYPSGNHLISKEHSKKLAQCFETYQKGTDIQKKRFRATFDLLARAGDLSGGTLEEHFLRAYMVAEGLYKPIRDKKKDNKKGKDSENCGKKEKKENPVMKYLVQDIPNFLQKSIEEIYGKKWDEDSFRKRITDIRNDIVHMEYKMPDKEIDYERPRGKDLPVLYQLIAHKVQKDMIGMSDEDIQKTGQSYFQWPYFPNP